MTDTPPDWVLIEAAKRIGWNNSFTYKAATQRYFKTSPCYKELCDMIWKYEQPPVDRKELCARKAMAGWAIELDPSGFPKEADMRKACIRAIELWEKGFGSD